MNPVLVLQHQLDDGPAYLAHWLRRRGVPMVCLCAEAGQEVPQTLAGYGALAILGGSMSANDALPGLRREEDLVRQAVSRGVPVIGHCLGGQLMARALGASVGTSIAPEIGWQAMTIADHRQARDWFGGVRSARVFQWHYEAFGLPEGAIRLASSSSCSCQAFALGPHLAMQFHVEVDAGKIHRWAAAPDNGYAQALADHPASVQSVDSMLAGISTDLSAQQALADCLFSRWLSAATR